MFCSHCWEDSLSHERKKARMIFNSTSSFFYPGVSKFVVRCSIRISCCYQLTFCSVSFLSNLVSDVWTLLVFESFSVKEEMVHKAFFQSLISLSRSSITQLYVVFEHVDQASFCVLIVLQPASMYRITVLLCRWYISLQMELSSTWRRKNYRMNIKYLNVMWKEWDDPSWECCIQSKCVNLSSYSPASHLRVGISSEIKL